MDEATEQMNALLVEREMILEALGLESERKKSRKDRARHLASSSSQ